MEGRVELLERAVGAGDGAGPLRERVRALQMRLGEIELQRPALAELGDHAAAVRQLSTAEGWDLVRANAARVDEMAPWFEDLKSSMRGEGIEQEAQPVQDVAAREARLSKSLVERQRLHSEVESLLSVYAQWVDSVAGAMLPHVDDHQT